MVGNESKLKGVAKMIRQSLDGSVVVEVVGLNMEDEREIAFDEAVDKAWKILGYLDALVHCYSYEGKYLNIYSSATRLPFFLQGHRDENEKLMLEYKKWYLMLEYKQMNLKRSWKIRMASVVMHI